MSRSKGPRLGITGIACHRAHCAARQYAYDRDLARSPVLGLPSSMKRGRAFARVTLLHNVAKSPRRNDRGRRCMKPTADACYEISALARGLRAYTGCVRPIASSVKLLERLREAQLSYIILNYINLPCSDMDGLFCHFFRTRTARRKAIRLFKRYFSRSARSVQGRSVCAVSDITGD